MFRFRIRALGWASYRRSCPQKVASHTVRGLAAGSRRDPRLIALAVVLVALSFEPNELAWAQQPQAPPPISQERAGETAAGWKQDSYELHNPTTGQTVVCKSEPYQFVPGLAVLDGYFRCITEHKRQGYVPDEKYKYPSLRIPPAK